MNKKIRIGILGCANIAKRYGIPAFQAIDNAEVVSIASRDYEKAKQWAAQFGIRAEKSYDSLIQSADIDAVYIPLPIGLHREWVLKAASHGKHVLCEKSLAENFEIVKEMVESCLSKNIILYENFMCDFHPQHEKVLSLSREGAIGELFVFRGYFGFPLLDRSNFRYSSALGGGSLNDAGAYTVRMARKMFEGEPISVYANLDHDALKKVDTKGTAELDFGEGVSAHIAFNFNASYQNSYSLWGSQGVVHVQRAYSIPPEMKPDVVLTTNKNSQDITTQIDIQPANHFELIFHDFCETIQHRKKEAAKISATYKNIINQAKVLQAIRISSIEKRRVLLSEIN